MSSAQEVHLMDGYHTLPRGGYLVETSLGYIQIGSPPETIKDTMVAYKLGTPKIFVLPDDFFHVNKGISVAELEFPLYYNHFIRKENMYVVCTRGQKSQLEIVLQHAVFGPEEVNLVSEYINGEKTYGYPDLMAEMKYFRGGRKLDDLVRFVIFDSDGQAHFRSPEEPEKDAIIIHKKRDGNFLIEDTMLSKEVIVPGKVDFKYIYDPGKIPTEPFKPPLFGVTCLGPSHGFDVNANTSGFIVWLQNKGVMIDPPVNSTEWLGTSNVNPKHIDSVILTHAHADHDAGTFQKILEEGRIRIYSTETVMYSFLTKYSALTKMSVPEMLELFEFVPVIIGNPYLINGAEFLFNYSLHSIPTFGFQFSFLDQSFVYSSDHLNDPKIYADLRRKGILTETRYQDLLNFPWYHKVVYHESGIPPLHTQISYLETLPPEVQKKTTIYHIAAQDVPDDSLLTLAKFGIEETVYPPITAPKYEKSIQLLDIISSIDIFRNFPLFKAKEFLVIVNEEKFAKGSRIIEKNTPGDKFYIIISGNVRLEGIETDTPADSKHEMTVKKFGNYEYFGEASLIMDTLRSATVIAETEVIALTIPKSKFLNFIKGSDLNDRLTRLVKIRNLGSWDILSSSRFLKGITSGQKTQLELIMRPVKIKSDQEFIRANERMEAAYIIKSGSVVVLKNNESLETLTRGDFCGEIYNLQKNLPSTLTFRALTDLEMFSISKDYLSRYLIDNPGVYMRMFLGYG